jgi:hypothetical protein
MSTNVLKLIAGAAAAIFILILIGILSVFAFYGKTTIEPVVYEIGVLITTALGLVTALAGHVAASSRNSAPTLPPGTQVTYSPPVPVVNTSISIPAGAPPVVPEVPASAQQ